MKFDKFDIVIILMIVGFICLSFVALGNMSDKLDELEQERNETCISYGGFYESNFTECNNLPISFTENYTNGVSPRCKDIIEKQGDYCTFKNGTIYKFPPISTLS